MAAVSPPASYGASWRPFVTRAWCRPVACWTRVRAGCYCRGTASQTRAGACRGTWIRTRTWIRIRICMDALVAVFRALGSLDLGLDLDLDLGPGL